MSTVVAVAPIPPTVGAASNNNTNRRSNIICRSNNTFAFTSAITLVAPALAVASLLAAFVEITIYSREAVATNNHALK
jgi:hypothetical protein